MCLMLTGVKTKGKAKENSLFGSLLPCEEFAAQLNTLDKAWGVEG